MSDVKHSRDAEAYLREAKEVEAEAEPHPIDYAAVHANLATARALREIDTTVRLGFKDVGDRMKKGSPPVDLIYLESADDGPIWINTRHVVAVRPDPSNDQQTIIDAIGSVHLVKGNVIDVSATIFQVVNSW